MPEEAGTVELDATESDATASDDAPVLGPRGDTGVQDTAAAPSDATPPSDGGTSETTDGAANQADAAPCARLVADPCWAKFVGEYAAVQTCFSHRTKCGDGDPSECGAWKDGAKAVCTWPDGSELDHNGTVDVIKSSSGTECYRRDYQLAKAVFTFGDRSYEIASAGAAGRRITCPDKSVVLASPNELTDCGPPDVCCSSSTPVACGEAF